MTKSKQNEELNKSIGSKIRALRLEKGMTLFKLAEFVNVTHQQIRKYESGQDSLSIGRLVLIAKVLKTKVAHFYKGILGEPNTKLTTTVAISKSSEKLINQCIEISQNFMKISDSKQQKAVSFLIKSLAKSKDQEEQ